MARILIAEDHEPLRRVLVEALACEGHEVLEAVDGQQLTDRYAEEDGNVDLIITDFSMPGLSGLQAFLNLRSWGSTVPVVLYCSQDGKVLDRCRKAGFAAVISKTSGINPLLDEVRKLTSQKAMVSGL